MSGDPHIKDYVDALNAERSRTNNWRTAAVAGTFGALIFGIMQAVKVYAAANANLFSLHNDLIRSGERKAAAQDATMATKAEVEPLKTFRDQQVGGQVSMGRVWAAVGATAPLAAAAGALLAKWLGL